MEFAKGVVAFLALILMFYIAVYPMHKQNITGMAASEAGEASTEDVDVENTNVDNAEGADIAEGPADAEIAESGIIDSEEINASSED